MFDRSIFYEELKRNPALITRLNTIVNGEVGHNAPLDRKLVQLETVFNRAAARGQTIEKVTREYTGPGSDGYYPRSTFVNGAPRSQNEANAFNEQVLKPVLAGSDRSTELLGFAATGNASGGVAARGKGTRYVRHADMGDPKNPETYVQERYDNIDRLNQYASGGSIPRPPADIPMTDVQLASAQPNTRDIQRTYPGYQAPTQIGVEGGAAGERVPLPYARGQSASGAAPLSPAPQFASGPPQKTVGVAPGRGFLQAMRQAFGQPQQQGAPIGFPGSRDDVPYDAGQSSLGNAMIKAMGPRGDLMSSFRDPTTGQQYLQGGSGEEAMGVLRPIGQAAARPAPAPQRPASRLPPSQRGAASVNPPREPVPPTPAAPPPPDLGGVTADEAQRRPLMPFDPRMFDATPSASAVPPSLTGLTPGGMPMAEDPVGMFDVKQPEPNFLRRTASFFDRNPPMWAAPPEAGLLAAPAPSTRPPQRPEPVDASVTFSRGGNTLTPGYTPTTVNQQLSGLSPFGTTPPQNGFASTTLLPFEQWPPLGWGWAGPASFDFGAWG